MRSRSSDVEPRRGGQTATASPHFPLRRLALCLDCDVCFEVGAATCPACGAGSWVLVSRFLGHTPLRLLPQLHALGRDRAASAGDRDRPAQQVLVIARAQRALFEYAKRAFAGNPTVQVVLDRRRGERRRSDRTPREPERRRGDRRTAMDLDEQLQVLGWALVRLDAFRALRTASR